MLNKGFVLSTCFFLLIISGVTAHAATISHFSATAFNTATKTSTGWSVVTGASAGPHTTASANKWIAGSNFTVGNSYLILLWGYHNANNNADRTGFRVTHGGTSFTESEGVEEVDQTNAAYLTPYFWFTVWTAANEDLEVQYYNDAANTARVEGVVLAALDVTSLLASNDLKYAISTVGGTPLTTTFTSKDQLAWTPSNNGDTWWIMGYTRADINTITNNAYSARLNIDNTIYMTAQQVDGEDLNDTPIYGMGWVQTFTNAAHTVDVECRQTTANPQGWLAAGVFALRLNYFDDFVVDATAGGQGIPAGLPGAYQTLATFSKTVTDFSYEWLIATGFINDDNNGRVVAHMLSDTVEVTPLDGGWQASITDVIPWTGGTLQGLGGAMSHTITVQGRTTNNILATAYYRWLAAIRLGDMRDRRTVTAQEQW